MKSYISSKSLENRYSCVICNSVHVQDFLTLPRMPVFMGVSTELKDESIFFDQNWKKCTECGCIFLSPLLPLEIVYQSNHHFSPIGDLWIDHHNSFAEFILSSCLEGSKRFLEIGGAHSYLASRVIAKRTLDKYTVVEPRPTQYPEGIEIVEGFIENYYHLLDEVDCIIHSHVLEHIYDPRTFFQTIAQRMRHGASLFISIPNLPKLIELRGSNSLNFEHTYLLDNEVVKFFGSISSLELVSQYAFREHSFFLHFRKNSVASTVNIKPPSLHRYASDFLDMWRDLSSFVLDVNRFLHNVEGANFLFGAHIFSQSLLSLGLKESDYMGVLDNSREKQGNLLYGTNLYVLKPEVVTEHRNPIVVLVGSHYDDEIKRQLIQLNPSVRILGLNSKPSH